MNKLEIEFIFYSTLHYTNHKIQTQYNTSHPLLTYFCVFQHKEENIIYIGVGFLPQINVKNMNSYLRCSGAILSRPKPRV